MKNFDETRGIDLMRGKKVCRHLGGSVVDVAIANAWVKQSTKHWIRYYGKKLAPSAVG